MRYNDLQTKSLTIFFLVFSNFITVIESSQMIYVNSGTTDWAIGQTLPGGNFATTQVQSHIFSGNGLTGASVIWYKYNNLTPGDFCHFSKYFSVTQTPSYANFSYLADDMCDIVINHKYVKAYSRRSYTTVLFSCDVTQYINVGANLLEVLVPNGSGSTGLVYQLALTF